MKIEDIRVGKFYRDNEDDLVVVTMVHVDQGAVTVYDYGVGGIEAHNFAWEDYVEVTQEEALAELNPKPKVEVSDVVFTITPCGSNLTIAAPKSGTFKVVTLNADRTITLETS